ncbi:DotI/IcmL/TraM family protein [Legionella sp. CNM-4043-24]|uniref:DotI/IcmL/TraM family protein n=1 Tax=Legionella sp. CNM-4043-24 TaxID=3421646 RepID=UPI00403AD84F
MTRIGQTAGVILLSPLLYPGPQYAATQSALAWTRQTLIDTFRLTHDNMDARLKQAESKYLPSAWSDLIRFFGDSTSTIRNGRLSLHPQATGPGQIITSGHVDGVMHWNIVQAIRIPELKMNPTFSVELIKAAKPPYLIQRVNVTTL